MLPDVEKVQNSASTPTQPYRPFPTEVPPLSEIDKLIVMENEEKSKSALTVSPQLSLIYMDIGVSDDLKQTAVSFRPSSEVLARS